MNEQMLFTVADYPAVQAETKMPAFARHYMLCGERGIRTLGTVARTTVFETVPFDRSGTSPLKAACKLIIPSGNCINRAEICVKQFRTDCIKLPSAGRH